MIKRLKHEHRIFWVAVLAGLPAVAAALAFLWIGGYSDQTKWTVMVFILVIWLGCAVSVIGKVMTEIEVAVFTFDGAQKLRLVNRAGERLLGKPSERLLNCNAADLGLADCLQGEPSRTMEVMLPGGAGRWGLRRTTFREHGMPHTLVVLTDLSRALREEEREAW